MFGCKLKICICAAVIGKIHKEHVAGVCVCVRVCVYVWLEGMLLPHIQQRGGSWMGGGSC